MSGTSLLTRVRARVDLHTSTKVRGLIAGRGRSLFKGTGEDFDDLKAYQPGDRIADIEWKATARSGEPLIRRFNEQRVRHLAVVADTSRQMDAAAADGSDKKEAMVLAAGLFCWIAQNSGDLVALIAGSDGDPISLPSRSSSMHLELLLRTIQMRTDRQAGQSASGFLLRQASRLLCQPTLILLVTDEAHPTLDDEQALVRLTSRHELIVVRIQDADPLGRDRLERRVQDVGVDRDLIDYVRTDRAAAREVDAFRTRRSEAISQMLDRVGADHVLTAGESTVVDDLVHLLQRRSPRGRR